MRSGAGRSLALLSITGALSLLAACTSGMGACREQYAAGSPALEDCYSAVIGRENARLNHQAEEELNAPGF